MNSMYDMVDALSLGKKMQVGFGQQRREDELAVRFMYIPLRHSRSLAVACLLLLVWCLKSGSEPQGILSHFRCGHIAYNRRSKAVLKKK